MKTMCVHEQLEQLADENRDRPLEILGAEIDKTDARQVYGALCWIENELTALLQLQRGV